MANNINNLYDNNKWIVTLNIFLFYKLSVKKFQNLILKFLNIKHCKY